MKIQTKISLLISLFIAAIVVSITLLSVHNIRDQGEKRIEALRETEIKRIKTHLEDMVNIVYESANSSYRNLEDDTFLARYYGKQLKNMVAAAESIVHKHQKLVQQGKMDLASAKQAAANEIELLNFSEQNEYVWVQDTGLPVPTMVMHPREPELNGKMLSDRRFRDVTKNGDNLFTLMVEKAVLTGETYIRYLWPKTLEDGSQEQHAKISYVKRIDEWQWMLGAGFFIDEAERDVRNQIIEAIRAMRYDNGVGYFWINDRDWPYPKMVMHPTLTELEGQLLNDDRFNNAMGRDQNLFQAIVEQTQREGSGFVDYSWPKPIEAGLTEDRDKISFVKEHTGLDWIIGTGVYLDSIDISIAEERESIEAQVAVLIRNSLIVAVIMVVLAIGAAILFARSLALPIQNLTMTAEMISKGRNLEEPVQEIDRLDEIGDLARSIDRLKSSVKIMMRRLPK